MSSPASGQRRSNPFPASLTFILLTIFLLVSPSPVHSTAEYQGSCSIPRDTAQDHDTSVVLRRMKQCDAGTSKVYRTPQVPLDTEHYPVAPAVLELNQVHVYVRHGERTPVGVRLSRPPASIPEHWMMCETARQFQTAVTNTTKDEFSRSRRVVERVDGVAAGAECLLGELTDLGRQSTYNFGKSLRELYVQKLGFLPDRLSKKEQAYFRSTNIPRTIESLQQAVHGLYPTEKCETGVLPDILVRNTKDENLLGNTYACKRLEILQQGFAQAAATAYNPTLEPLDARIAKYLDGKPIRVDGKPRASGIMDTVRAAIAHGIEVPPEFEDKSVVDVIERAVVSEWFAGYKTEEVRRLGMGRLLDDLASKMQHKADKGSQDPLKILVHTTHDTALAALCSTLDVFDDQWPAFTASITFELFKKRAETRTTGDASLSQTVLSSFRSKPTTEHFVRMRYQNKNMVLPFCADEGKHLPGSPEFCALAAFRERVKELTPRNFEAECAPAGRSG